MAVVKDNILEYLFGRGQCKAMGRCMIFAFSALFLWLLWGNLQNMLFPSVRESAEMHFLYLLFDLLSFQVQLATAFTYRNLVSCTHSHTLVLSCLLYTCNPLYRHH